MEPRGGLEPVPAVRVIREYPIARGVSLRVEENVAYVDVRIPWRGLALALTQEADVDALVEFAVNEGVIASMASRWPAGMELASKLAAQLAEAVKSHAGTVAEAIERLRKAIDARDISALCLYAGVSGCSDERASEIIGEALNLLSALEAMHAALEEAARALENASQRVREVHEKVGQTPRYVFEGVGDLADYL